jgi:hypothetical protein
VHVRVDEPRKNGRFAEVMNFVIVDSDLIWGDNGRIRSPSTSMAAGRIPSGVTTRRERANSKCQLLGRYACKSRAYSGRSAFSMRCQRG